MPASLSISRTPLKVGGIAQEMWRGLQGTLDFWAALLIAVTGTLYRLFGRAPEPEAFPILSLFVGIAMSTIAQRMLRLDEGRALLRYRLLPIAGWKLLVTLDMTFLIPLAVMVSLLNLRTGVAFGLIAIAVGRYPSLRQRANQRRWRFVGGDPRFGVAQVLLGGLAGIGAARRGSGSWPLPSPSTWFPYSGENCSGNAPESLVEKHVPEHSLKGFRVGCRQSGQNSIFGVTSGLPVTREVRRPYPLSGYQLVTQVPSTMPKASRRSNR